MKKILLFWLTAGLLVACTSKTSTTEATTADSSGTAKKESLAYPYTPKYSINWQPGDEKYSVIALESLKKYTDGDVKGSMKDWADTIEIVLDKMQFKGTKDSVTSIFTKERAIFAEMVVEPDSWQTVYFPDKKESWVTIWYKQKWSDKKGKKDSAYFVDDLLVKDGKIALLDEKQRYYPVAKK